MNGNQWVGTGHNSVFQDGAGNWFTAFHGIDQRDPYFEGATGYTRRPLLLDRLDWDGADGWPSVRGGLGASTTKQFAALPRAPRDARAAARVRSLANMIADATDPNAYLRALDAIDPTALSLIASASDELDGTAVSPQWSWVRPPAAGGFDVADGQLRFATQAAELYGGSNDASVLTEAVPSGNWLAEVKLDLDLPSSGCCFNYVQAGLVVYANDDAYVKLVHTSIWETRQIEFAKEIPAPAPGLPMYGSSVGGPPGETTWLRIARVLTGGKEAYVSYSSHDGRNFARGAVWTHELGANAKLGLIALGGSGFNARFDHVRVWRLPTF
jgi:arabinan endo-1,5-alpha-L-arabinosidase